jgi:hypothetical protein
MTIHSGRPRRLSALRRKRWAAVRFRRPLNQNSTVSPLLSMARHKYIQRPRTLMPVSSMCHFPAYSTLMPIELLQ